MEIANKGVLVTGGASGLGAACVRLLSQCGAKVVIADMHGKDLQKAPFKTGINSIDISGYASGMYIVTFKTKQGSQTEK